MRSEAEITANVRPGKAFSNHTQWEIWSARWCQRCMHDDGETELWCPIITVALVSPGTPAEWVALTETDEIHGSYTCTEFDERRDDDPTDPQPEPEPEPPSVCEGQLDLIDVYLDTAIAEFQKVPEVAR